MSRPCALCPLLIQILLYHNCGILGSKHCVVLSRALEIINDLPIGFPINNIISLWGWLDHYVRNIMSIWSCTTTQLRMNLLTWCMWFIIHIWARWWDVIICTSWGWLYHDILIMGWLPIKIIGLFCKKALLKRRYSAKEPYNLIDPTNCSHPISWIHDHVLLQTGE